MRIHYSKDLLETQVDLFMFKGNEIIMFVPFFDKCAFMMTTFYETTTNVNLSILKIASSTLFETCDSPSSLIACC
jgi:hypothetical protein